MGLNEFAPVMIFLNGFAPVFDRWPGFQIGSVIWLIGGVDRWLGLGF